MVREITITPEALIPDPNRDMAKLSEGLQNLCHQVQPLKGVFPLIVGDLWEGALSQQFSEMHVMAIRDGRVREKVQRLLGLLKDRKLWVPRPSSGHEYPDDENGWLSEALASARAHPIEQIITSGTTPSDDARVSALTAKSDFWDQVFTEWDAPMDLEAQIGKLRALCVHSNWLCYVSSVALKSEKRFVRTLIETAAKTPEGWPSAEVHIDIHSDDDNTTEALLREFEADFRGAIPATQTVRIFRWPQQFKCCKERFVLAGHKQPDKEPKSAQWGVSTPHVFFGSTEPDQPKSPWTLASSQRTNAWFKRLYTQNDSCSLPNPVYVLRGPTR